MFHGHPQPALGCDSCPGSVCGRAPSRAPCWVWSGSFHSLQKGEPDMDSFLGQAGDGRAVRSPGPPNAPGSPGPRTVAVSLQLRSTRPCSRTDAYQRIGSGRLLRKDSRQRRQRAAMSALAGHRRGSQTAPREALSREQCVSQSLRASHNALWYLRRYRALRPENPDADALIGVKRVSPHSLRHTTATHLLRAGVDINTVRAWLGHVSLDTTNIYAKIDLEMKAKALAKCEVTNTNSSNRHGRDDPALMTFLRTLSTCRYVASRSVVPFIPTGLFAGRHINLAATYRIKCVRAHLMREIRSYGSVRWALGDESLPRP